MDDDDALQALAYAEQLKEQEMDEEIEQMEDTRHADAMREVAEANASGINIHGKRYTTVAKRVEIFRRHFGTGARLRIAESQIGDNAVRMTAVIELRTEGGAWELVAEGRAEEIRTERGINSTSALEVCETSAYGRALANLGLHGGEFASANEVEQAVAQQGARGWKDNSGRPDTSQCDPETVAAFVESFKTALLNSDVNGIMEMHHQLRTEAELYTAVSDKLTSKQRADLRKIITESKEAA